MGEKGNEKVEDKREEKSITAVLKVDLHCEGCTSRIKKMIRALNGVETVKAEAENRLTVVGNVDPVKLREILEKKTKKKFELVSPLPKKAKDGVSAGGQKKNDDGGKAEEKRQQLGNNNTKEPPVTTVVLKVAWHCQGCIRKIHKAVYSYNGVHTMSIDKENNLVTVKGTMDSKALVLCLKEKLRRPIEIVPEKKDKDKEKERGKNKDNEKGGDKTNCSGDGGEKECGGSATKNGKVEANKFEYFVSGAGYGYRDANSGYVVDLFHACQLFSDENANGCVIM
ncbi:hypothetical protein Nepgr_000613 [Nepenthes gracilis]|uniref:HMA domain-containing protein n=1 Tax=Nepenthes gracilis TaxID=150966 RepID=A0AAD3RWC5_NEPGR|nr:hypothetical protein Nepgr_000613 [Nepenthes gracilis]